MAGCALVIIDMQKAYFNNDALKQQQASLTDACNQLINYAHAQDMPVYNVRTQHKRDTSTWTLNMLEDEQGYLFEGDNDCENVAGLQTEQTIEILKTRDSAFYKTSLEDLLRIRNIDKLIICGVSTHTCVSMTAADAYAANIKVTLITDAIASHNPSLHEPALYLLQDEYRQTAKTVNDLIRR